MTKKRVLIIDDDALSRAMARDLLTAAGYDLAEAADGPEGFGKVETFRPDLILLDVLMPGLDGYEVCQRLKANPATAHIAVIFVTGMKDEAVQQLAMKAGAAAYLTKPFHPEKLLADIAAALVRAECQTTREPANRLEAQGHSGGSPDLNALARRLDAILDRLDQLEVQVRGLTTNQTVEARDFVLKDDRARIRARLEIQEYSPRLTFYDTLGQERLQLGLWVDGSPSIRVEGREIPLGEGEARTT